MLQLYQLLVSLKKNDNYSELYFFMYTSSDENTEYF